MSSKELTSLQHPLVKHLVKLRKERHFRAENKTVLIVGVKMVCEYPKKIITLLVKKDTSPPKQLTAEKTIYVTEEILKKISGTSHPESLAAEVELPEEMNLKGKNLLLYLDGINDPGNLGTLLRSALALGWDGALISENSVDPFNEKALRAAKGATFRFPLKFVHSVEELSNFHFYVADAKGKPFESVTTQKPLILVLGSESHGPSSFMKERFSSISIPLKKQVESLNVAIAGSILMYHLGKG